MNKAASQTRQQTTISLSPAQGILQRKCDCGNHTVAGGECEECSKKKMQRKLTIGASNDPLEQEADRVADQVMAASAHSVVSGTPPRIQRYAGQATEGTDTAPASVDRVLARSLSDLPLKYLIFSELIFLAILKKQFKISILLIKSDRLLALAGR